jgi:hypothetical protein
MRLRSSKLDFGAISDKSVGNLQCLTHFLTNSGNTLLRAVLPELTNGDALRAAQILRSFPEKIKRRLSATHKKLMAANL